MTALRVAAPPPEDADEEEERDVEGERWSRAEHLLATLIDVQRNALHAFYLANSDGKGRKPEPPDPVLRPGITPPAKRRAPTAEARQWLFDMIGGGAGT